MVPTVPNRSFSPQELSDQCTETHSPTYTRFTQTPPAPITVKMYMTGAQFARSGGVVPLPAEILSFPRLDSHGAY